MSGELKAVNDIVDKRKRKSDNLVEYLIEWSDGTESWETRKSLLADGGDAAKAYIRQYEKRARGEGTPKRAASRGRATTAKKSAKSPAAKKAKSPARKAKSPAAKKAKSPARKAKSPAKKAKSPAKKAKSPAKKAKTPAKKKTPAKSAKKSSKRAGSRARARKPEPEPEPESEEEEDEQEQEHGQEDEVDERTDDFEDAAEEDDEDDDYEPRVASSSPANEGTTSPRVMPPIWVLAAWAGATALAAYTADGGLPAVLSVLSPVAYALPFLTAIAYVWELPAQGRLLDPSQAQATAAGLLMHAADAAIGGAKGILGAAVQAAAAVFRLLAAAGRPGDSHGASAAPLPVSIVSIGAAAATVLVATSAATLYNAEDAGPLAALQCSGSPDSAALGYPATVSVPFWGSARGIVSSVTGVFPEIVGTAVDFPLNLAETASAAVYDATSYVAFNALPCALQPANVVSAAKELPFFGSKSIVSTETVMAALTFLALAAAWARIGARPAGSLGSGEQWALLVGVLVLGLGPVGAAATKMVAALGLSQPAAAVVVKSCAGMALAIGAGTS